MAGGMWSLVGATGRACRRRESAARFLHSALLCDGNRHLHSVGRHAGRFVAAAAGNININGGGGGGIIRCKPSGLVAAAASVAALPWLLQQQVGGKRGLARPRGPRPTGTVQGSHGTYQFGQKLGSGTFGDVYLGVNVQTQEQVAIKTMDNQVLQSEVRKSRIRVTREISAMMQIRHPSVTALYDVAYDPRDATGKLCMVMEYLAGGTLDDYVDLHGQGGGTGIPEDDARRFFQQLIDAVDFCHRMDIVHRDLKPTNLLLDGAGNLKVADFGLSAIDVSSSGPLKSLVGTLAYEAPEIILAGQSPNGYEGTGADVWSCGVILFYFLAGFTPFSRAGSNKLDLQRAILSGVVPYPPNFPPGAQWLVSQILCIDPALRITTPEMYHDTWFMTNYRPPDYRLIWEVKVNREAIEDLFNSPPDPRYDAGPSQHLTFTLPRPPRVWFHKEVPVNKFVFGPGDKNRSLGEDKFVQDETFTLQSTYDPDVIIAVIQATLRALNCPHRTRQFTINVFDDRNLNAIGEPLELLIDVVSAPPPRDRYVIHFRRVTGFLHLFDALAHEVASRCSRIMQPC